MSIPEIARQLLERAGRPGSFDLTPLPGGRNNRVWRVDSEESPFLLKQYYWVENDTRDRMGHEWDFLAYLHGIGSRAAAAPLAADKENRCALLEFIPGVPPSLSEVSEPDIRAAADFFAEMNASRFSAAGRALPVASEASFSLAEHVATTERRIRRLDQIANESDLHNQARDFVLQMLLPLWERVRSRVVEFAPALGGLETALPPEARCLSPSDFGFHNSLRTPEGNLRFVDFEYAGWDDPAKTVVDFANQPDLLLDPRLADHFSSAALAIFPGGEFPARVTLLTPLYQLKWACICLNEFLPSGASRRAFTGLKPDEGLTRLAGHLDRARVMAARAGNSLDFPLPKSTFLFPSRD